MSAADDALATATALVKRALAAGAEAAEVSILDSRSTRLAAEGAYLRPTEMTSESIGLRVVVDGRFGLAGKRGLAQHDALVALALRHARENAVAAHGGFAPPIDGPLPRVADATIESGDETRLSDFVERASAHARAMPDVTYVRVAAADKVKRLTIANSLGLEVSEVSTTERVEVETRITRGTTERTGTQAWLGSTCVDRVYAPEALAERPAADARRALDAQPLPRAVQRVVLAPPASTQILAVASSAFGGVGLHAGKSALAGRLGERVASDAVTLLDDARGEVGKARRAIDDEGTQTRTVPLVEHGILRSFLHTRATAAQAGAPPTGSAKRSGLDVPPSARPVNIAVAEGSATLDDLIAAEESAVLVTQPLMGAFVASRVTGDFSLVAPYAFYVENGKVRHAIPPTTIGGNALQVLASVDAVGNDPQPLVGGRAPSIRAGGISCAT